MNVETASRLAGLRKKYGFSQEELAEKIGVSRQAVSKWERAESSPDTENLIALSKIYSLSLDDMLNHDNPKERSYDPAKTEKGDDDEKTDTYKLMKRIPIPIICTIAYLLMGFVWGLWHPGWLVFMIIPIWYTIFN